MNLTNIILLFFLMGALSIGMVYYENGINLSSVDSAVNNATQTILNISLQPTGNSESVIRMESVFLIIEKLVHFVGVLALEIFRIGVHFGYDNPSYFEPMFLLTIMKWIIILIFVSLLIKPLFYLGIIIIMFFIWLKDKREKKRNKTKSKLNQHNN